jgi:putative flavoprotein involved in K+ transport
MRSIPAKYRPGALFSSFGITPPTSHTSHPLIEASRRPTLGATAITTIEPATASAIETATWLEAFADALARNDAEAAANCFHEDSYWRDLVAFTWNIKTLEGRDQIYHMLQACNAATAPTDWQLEGDPTTTDGVTDAWLTFATNVGRAKGRLRLRDGKAWQLFTALQELTGHEEKQSFTRDMGVDHGAHKDRTTWLQRRQREQAELGDTTQPYVLIIGGGQGGIALAARLRRLNVPSIVVERNQNAGDSWRNRYDSLVLHDPVWFDHMPYLPFPDHWPIYTPKDQMGDWLETYVKIMELNYWTSTECTHAEYDAAANSWRVDLLRDGQPLTLRPTHLVLATGMSGFPNIPNIPGAETFTGDIMHSSEFRTAASYTGKQAIVLGSNNSAQDIAHGLWENDAATVTLIQRSPTTVVRSGGDKRSTAIGNYSETAVAAGITTDCADLISASEINALAPIAAKQATAAARAANADFYARLEASGFLLDFGPDETGISMKYARRGSGYYIDVGASELVINGDIKLHTRVSIERITPNTVVLTDGTELSADLIVYGTGYGNMVQWAEKLISKEVADRVGQVWGLGSNTQYDPGPWEGELRNMWKPTQQPNLWFHGGNLAGSRSYSIYLALQLKARLEHIPTPVYGIPPVQQQR